MDKLREDLKIDDYLTLIKEDKNLNMGYVSLAQYINLLEQALNKIRAIITTNDELSKQFLLIKSIPKEVKEDILKIIDEVGGNEE